jgi:hypothetical protein
MLMGIRDLLRGDSMTNGINGGDVVRIKASGQLARVVAVDDHHDRIPADLQVDTVDGLVKVRVDEVQTFSQFLEPEPLWPFRV